MSTSSDSVKCSAQRLLNDQKVDTMAAQREEISFGDYINAGIAVAYTTDTTEFSIGQRLKTCKPSNM